MSYISAETYNSKVIVWERHGDKRIAKPYNIPYYFYTEAAQGKYESIHGKKLIRHDFHQREPYLRGLSKFLSNGSPIYESTSLRRAGKFDAVYNGGIPAELKVLAEHYYNVPTPALNNTFLDIEIDYDPTQGFAGVANPYAEINSIAMYHQWCNRTVLYAIPPKEWRQSSEDWKDLLDPSLLELSEIVLVETEEELLEHILSEVQDSDCLVGWNSDYFDIPYIVKRMELVLGEKLTSLMSFPDDTGFYKNPYPRTATNSFGIDTPVVELIGRLKADYMELFRKFEQYGQPSYKLEAIADVYLPDLPKLEYEGSLYTLYNTNFNHFLRYNIRDVEILKGLEDKLGYVALAHEMYHLSCGLMKHVAGTIQLAGYAIINYAHNELNKIVPDVLGEENTGSIKGALVIPPATGLHRMFGSIDIKSLYPSTIMTLNISPETVIGQFTDDEEAWETIRNKKDTLVTLVYDDRSIEPEVKSGKEWFDHLYQHKWAVSGYGTVLDQSKEGMIPAVVKNWFATRKKYQKMLIEAKQNGDKQKAQYYDRLQYVFKIKLNSLYGALSNAHFKFFDRRLGESVTATGRAILTHQISTVGEALDGNYSITAESIVAGDTDSTYFLTYQDTIDNGVKVAKSVADHVNQSFPPFIEKSFRCQPGYDKFITAECEILSDGGIFITKKHYIAHICWKDGFEVDEMKAMGLSIKRTTTPKLISKDLEKIIRKVLLDDNMNDVNNLIVDTREDVIHKYDLKDIGLPKGVKGVEEYTQSFDTDPSTRLPGHVAAAIHYNMCLKLFKDTDNFLIASGNKIRVYYLKKGFQKYINYPVMGDNSKTDSLIIKQLNRFKSIALPTDLVEIPFWFEEMFLKQIDRETHAIKLIDNNLEHIFNAIDREVPTKQTILRDTLFVFED